MNELLIKAAVFLSNQSFETIQKRAGAPNISTFCINIMALYFYKGYDGDLQYFIKCEWVNDVDYTVDQDPELPICNLTLTTLKEFWLGTGRR